MESPTKPSFVLVPGVYHTQIHIQSLVDALHAKGHDAEVIAHPTLVQATTAAPNADAANIRQVLEKLVVTQQKDIILFCHSYGGFPGSQSVNGLERSARAKGGEKGGVLKVIYLSAMVPPEGESVMQIMAGAEITPGEWSDMDPATGLFKANSKAAAVLFHDLPDDQAQYWTSKLEPMSAHLATAPAINVCWDAEVPKVYIFCKHDRAFSLQEQQRMLSRVQGDKKGDWETYEMDCGHSPFLSHVEELTDIMVKA
ncbi:Alpha/beta hydrolase fold-1 [Mycena polygramma]|nr:Alpha/beta hydrolase fold-1 [Mycena polygramma]